MRRVRIKGSFQSSRPVYIGLAFAVTLLCGCAARSEKIPGTNLVEKKLELKLPVKTTPAMAFEQLAPAINELNTYAGGYPPRFANEQEREAIYGKWLSLAAEAEAYHKENAGTEKALYLLSEIYRQGHNMDVAGSGDRALQNIEHCLSSYPQSISCNFSASYFFLSIGRNHLDKAEYSLETLRKSFAPELNSEVEAGYVFLYLYQQKVPLAKQQIDFFLENFPESGWAKPFADMKANLGETIEWTEQ